MRRFTTLKFRLTKSIGLAVLLTFLLTLTAMGQTTTGTLHGTVTDPSGAVVAGATVNLTNPQTGAERVAETNSNGVFDFQTLQPGKYTVSVEAKGFKRALSPDIIVSVSTAAEVNIPLEVGSPNESVTGVASQEVINTSSPSVTNIINTRQVTDLRGSSVSGLRQTAVNLTQDGINAMDNFVKTSSFFAITTPSLNSTSEFSITTNTVGSDAGRGAANVN